MTLFLRPLIRPYGNQALTLYSEWQRYLLRITLGPQLFMQTLFVLHEEFLCFVLSKWICYLKVVAGKLGALPTVYSASIFIPFPFHNFIFILQEYVMYRTEYIEQSRVQAMHVHNFSVTILLMIVNLKGLNQLQKCYSVIKKGERLILLQLIQLVEIYSV